MAITRFKIIQWLPVQYQSKAHMQLPVGISYRYFLQSYTVSKILWITGQIFAVDRTVPGFNALVLGKLQDCKMA